MSTRDEYEKALDEMRELESGWCDDCDYVFGFGDGFNVLKWMLLDAIEFVERQLCRCDGPDMSGGSQGPVIKRPVICMRCEALEKIRRELRMK